MSVVVLWFGAQQLLDASTWVGVLPAWTEGLSINPITLILLNGWFEVIFGLALLFGFYTRIVALLLALHLFNIVLTVGYNDIGVRDFGLAVSTLAVFLFGSSRLAIDNLFVRQSVVANTKTGDTK